MKALKHEGEIWSVHRKRLICREHTKPANCTTAGRGGGGGFFVCFYFVFFFSFLPFGGGDLGSFRIHKNIHFLFSVDAHRDSLHCSVSHLGEKKICRIGKAAESAVDRFTFDKGSTNGVDTTGSPWYCETNNKKKILKKKKEDLQTSVGPCLTKVC